MNVKKLSILLSSTLALGAISTVASDALALDATDDILVTASIVASCTIVATPVSFGNYDPIVANLTSPLDSTGTVTVTCTEGASTTIKLGQGANADTLSSDAVPARRMLNGTANYLSYTLSSDAARSIVWGNEAGSSVSHTGTGASEPFTVYGRLAAGQNKPIGLYEDTVVATVTF